VAGHIRDYLLSRDFCLVEGLNHSLCGTANKSERNKGEAHKA
jgi:hypothetical protein